MLIPLLFALYQFTLFQFRVTTVSADDRNMLVWVFNGLIAKSFLGYTALGVLFFITDIEAFFLASQINFTAMIVSTALLGYWRAVFVDWEKKLRDEEEKLQ
jgi:hypothetical protein